MQLHIVADIKVWKCILVEFVVLSTWGRISRAGEIGCVQEAVCWKEVSGMLERNP